MRPFRTDATAPLWRRVTLHTFARGVGHRPRRPDRSIPTFPASPLAAAGARARRTRAAAHGGRLPSLLRSAAAWPTPPPPSCAPRSLRRPACRVFAFRRIAPTTARRPWLAPRRYTRLESAL